MALLTRKETFLHFKRPLQTAGEVSLWLDEDLEALNFDDGRKIDLLDIVDVRYGCETDTFMNQIEPKENCIFSWMMRKTSPECHLRHRLLLPNYFSIIYLEDQTRKTLDLQSEDPPTALLWCRELKVVIDDIPRLRHVKGHRDWLLKQFQQGDSTRSGLLPQQDICQLLNDLNLYRTDEEIKVLFHFANTNPVQQVGFLFFFFLKKPILFQFYFI